MTFDEWITQTPQSAMLLVDDPEPILAAMTYAYSAGWSHGFESAAGLRKLSIQVQEAREKGLLPPMQEKVV